MYSIVDLLPVRFGMWQITDKRGVTTECVAFVLFHILTFIIFFSRFFVNLVKASAVRFKVTIEGCRHRSPSSSNYPSSSMHHCEGGRGEGGEERLYLRC